MAVASLQQAVAKGVVKPDDVVMLNITGGGECRFHAEHDIHYLQPSHIFKIGFTKEEMADVLAEMK